MSYVKGAGERPQQCEVAGCASEAGGRVGDHGNGRWVCVEHQREWRYQCGHDDWVLRTERLAERWGWRASLTGTLEKLAEVQKWVGDYADDDVSLPDALGELDGFLHAICETVGADSFDVFESYDPLLEKVAQVVQTTIIGLLEHMTPEQVAAFNEDYCRSLARVREDA